MSLLKMLSQITFNKAKAWTKSKPKYQREQPKFGVKTAKVINYYYKLTEKMTGKSLQRQLNMQ